MPGRGFAFKNKLLMAFNLVSGPDMQQQKVMSWLSQHNFPYGLLSFADGLSADPLGHKRAHLIDLIESHDIIISYAYGSNKDVTVYNSIGLQANQIFTVGKVRNTWLKNFLTCNKHFRLII